MTQQITKISIFILIVFACIFYGSDFSAEVVSYTKIGFNQQSINEEQGAYPTDSFSVFYGSASYDKIFQNHLSLGIGIAIGGVVYDSTKNNGNLSYKYLGYSQGFLGTQKATANNTQNYMIKNLYLGYEGDSFQFKIGRFVLREVDWLTGYQSAIQMIYKKSVYKVYFVASGKKASYGGKWLKDFKTMSSISTSTGVIPNYVPAVVLGFKYNPQHLLINTFFQFQANRYFAPGLRIKFDHQFSDVNSATDFIALVVAHRKTARDIVTSYDIGFEPVFGSISSKNPYLQGYSGRRSGWGGISLGIKQIFSFKSYHFGVQLYGNIGNPNVFIGRYGNPIGIDLSDNTVYDRGTANNALFDANSFSFIICGGKKFKNLDLKFFNRITTSQRTFEENFSINTSYAFTKQTSLGVNLSLYEVKTQAGYKIYHTYLKKSRWDDRSFMSIYFSHRF